MPTFSCAFMVTVFLCYHPNSGPNDSHFSTEKTGFEVKYSLQMIKGQGPDRSLLNKDTFVSVLSNTEIDFFPVEVKCFRKLAYPDTCLLRNWICSHFI